MLLLQYCEPVVGWTSIATRFGIRVPTSRRLWKRATAFLAESSVAAIVTIAFLDRSLVAAIAEIRPPDCKIRLLPLLAEFARSAVGRIPTETGVHATTATPTTQASRILESTMRDPYTLEIERKKPTDRRQSTQLSCSESIPVLLRVIQVNLILKSERSTETLEQLIRSTGPDLTSLDRRSVAHTCH